MSKINYKVVFDLFLSYELQLLSTEYVDCKTALDYKCKCGEIRKISLKSLKDKIRLSKDGCLFCNKCKSIKICTKKDKQEVVDDFKENGCQLLENTYVNNRTPMKYKCICGNISKITYDNFKKGRRCKGCKREKVSALFRKNENQVLDFFVQQGCKLKSKYINAKIPLDFTCKCGRSGKKLFSEFLKVPKCTLCSNAGRSGVNHPKWIVDREQILLNKRIHNKSRKMLRRVLKKTNLKKEKCFNQILGYTNSDLKKRLESFDYWDDIKSKNWHIDHIFPIKAFIDHNILDIRIINSLDNLRPLLAQDNLLKGADYNTEEFLKWIKGKI